MAAVVVELEAGTIQVDAAVIGAGLGIPPSLVPNHLRAGRLTSLCERGVDDDAGRYRLTFFHAGRRFRLVIDQSGRVIQRSTIDFGDGGVPAGARRPGR